MVADAVTLCRIVLSVILFFPLRPAVFTVLYALCGVSDILDGYIARKLKTESKRGEILDSIADMFFAVSYIFAILPGLFLPFWIWIWTVIIAAVKIIAIILKSREEKRLFIRHSLLNRLTGLMLFILPLAANFVDEKCCAAAVCIAASLAAAEDIYSLKGCKNE